MKFCPQCGTTLEPGSRFCQECGCDTKGYEVAEPETPAVANVNDEALAPVPEVFEEITGSEPFKTCPKCSSGMLEEERFCQECGFDSASATPVVAEELITPSLEIMAEELGPAEHGEAEPPEIAGEKQFCSNCGASMIAGDVFCQECGFNSAATEPVPSETIQPSQPVNVAQDIIPVLAVEKEVKPAPEVKQFCPNCGVSMVTGDVFCQECGFRTDVQAEIPVVPVPEIQPAKSDPVIVVPPVPPVAKQTSGTYVAAAANQAPAQTAKKKKGVMIVLLGILALAVIGAGGWFAYDKFLKTPATPVADSTAMAIQQESIVVAEPETADTSTLTQQAVTEVPVAEPQKPAQTKQATSKKTTPKKQATEPKKPEPQNQEPAQNNQPLKVKIKPAGSKTGRTILSIYNDNEVKSGPLFASKLKLDQAFIITKITTYHYNWGKGAQPGTISLQKKKETFGPWQASGVSGDDGTPNAKWVCELNQRLEEGTYKVEVSDEKSWSYNGQSGQKGFVVIEGYEAE
ncbi:MAG: zinc ribbon domain-containing protein [Bacteroidales bacterium]|nr:zinc ribbon domain-containing protein [Bacteroidales bacterium]